MTRAIFSEGYFRPPEDAYAAFEITPSIGQKRLFVMAIRSGISAAGYAPAADGATVYSPEAFQGDWTNVAYPSWPARVLPGNGGIAESRQGESYWARPVAGRVVSDEEGRLCEVVGRELRLLSHVVRSPQGQLLELLPARACREAVAENVIDGELVDEAAARVPRGQEKMAAHSSMAARQAAGASRIRCRRLFADPGLPRVVELGKFRRALASQLAHAERLRDLHHLACHVQIYEALARQRADEFLEAIQCAGHQNIPIEPLTEESIAMLGLKELLARHPRPPQDSLREPGYVLPFECFYGLRISSDPTAETVESTGAAASTARDVGSESAVAGPVPPGSQQANAPSSPRDIPKRFQNPWEFQFDRDEVMYDMNIGAASTGSVRALLRKFGKWFRHREEFRRWRALLCVKNLEEQLWAVRPPRGSVSDPSVREWARQTLEGAGYDSRAMLLEWEIFWRRKGV